MSLLLMTGAGCQPSGQDGRGSVRNKLLSRQFNSRPKGRIGSYASSTLGTHFLDPHHLGSHGYRFNLSEHNGILYTCRAGHIDTYHLREAADWTGLFAAKTFRHLSKNDRKFAFRLKEGSPGIVRLSYPEIWEYLSPKEREYIAYDVSIRLGRYFAYTAMTWHEIVTWFGYKCTGIFPEFPSAFSWEDSFSNVLGTHIGALALRDNEHTFSEAVTLLLEEELEKLDVQPGDVAKRAANAVKGTWFSGSLPFFVDMRRRNFDIGLDDGFVTPCVVPSIRECEGMRPCPYPVPELDVLEIYGFSMRFEIEPKEWEADEILSVVYPDERSRRKRLEPAVHFAPIMEHIKKEAQEMYGPDVACSPDN